MTDEQLVRLHRLLVKWDVQAAIALVDAEIAEREREAARARVRASPGCDRACAALTWNAD
jgi:hypothetical protein